MNQYFAYIRVSTARQGELGVSLEQQRDAIMRYAQRGNMALAQWFEERETAARAGRPVFTQMIRQLKAGKARGVVIHKIDRSARNLRDWADLGEMIDRGVEVHFANEGLDLNSRGGRLSADIQAVVASDFIRNLKEETKKGFYGRLKQGILPMPAPLGYRNIGGGKPKEPDLETAPLVRHLFEMYSTGATNFHDLLLEAERLGLHGRSGKRITLNGLTKLLNNTFYMGLIQIKVSGQSFIGAHEPLISKALFDRVQDVLHGKTNTRTNRHDLLFRRRLSCKGCGYTLIGETHKGFVYYRCQTRECPTTAIREQTAENSFLETFSRLQFLPDEQRYCWQEARQLKADSHQHAEDAINSLKLKLGQMDDRLNRLTDAYIDRLVERDVFEQRKTALLSERLETLETLAGWESGNRNVADEMLKILERANTAYSAYKVGIVPEKREMVDLLTSNRVLNGKLLEITPSSPFDLIANRTTSKDGSPRRDIHRTCHALVSSLMTFLQREKESQEKIAA
jgi:DNA invertase Pin-like site-specific DNA recombinase